VHTLAPRLTALTMHATRHATTCHAATFYHAANAMTASTAPGVGAVVVIVVTILVMTALARAARSLAALVSDLLRMATAVTSVLLTTALAIFVGIAFLMH
jgi:hypothetical protein